MALTRKMLTGMGLTEEQVEAIIDAHSESLNGLKQERDSLKSIADKVPGLETELATAKKTIEESNGKDSTYKVKYDALKEDFDKFKETIEGEKITSKKNKIYTDLLQELGIPAKRFDAILKVTDLSSIKLDEQGNVSNADELKANIKADWSDFIVSTTQQGTNTANPPANNTKTFTVDDIRKMSASEINENYEAIKASLKQQ